MTTHLPPWTELSLYPDLAAHPWPKDELTRELAGQVENMGILPNGTGAGRATVALTVRLPDGRVIVGETTLRLFAGAARALCASPIAEREGVTWR